jgi:type IV pilus assembly protein PilW
MMRTALRTSNRQRGLSLIELMIALFLGGLLIVSVSSVYLGSRQSFRQTDALARMQENARYAFEAMSVDIRQAGFTGCAATSKTYSSLNGTDWYNALATQPLAGYESGASLPADVTGALAGTDALSVLRADNNSRYLVANHDGPSAQFQLTANHDLKEGEILTVVPPDCSKAVVFQMTNVNSSNTIDVVVHNTGTGAPGNSTKCLDDPLSALCTGAPSGYPSLPADSRILRMSGHIYFVGTNGNGQPAIYREVLSASGGAATATAEELVEGVENMQILFGEDTNTDQSVDTYVTADAVTLWANVLAVRVSLLMRTVEDGVVSQTQSVSFNGATVTPTDRRLRKVFTMTFAVRNRI